VKAANSRTNEIADTARKNRLTNATTEARSQRLTRAEPEPGRLLSYAARKLTCRPGS
jgi:hypothetical protein